MSEAEKTEIVERFTSDGMGDLPVNIAHAKFMDSGVYLASASSCARVMNEYYREMNRVVLRNPVKRIRPELVARGPNEVWCWDITWLHSEVTGKYYYLYLIIDMYSRFIVGWSVHTKEDGVLARHLFADAIEEHCSSCPAKLLVHADNGKPMRSKDLKSLFEKLNVMSSHGRPHTSNDNAFAESIFATMKGRVIYPEFFGCIEDAEAFVAKFVEWYNYEHLHSSLDLLTPYSVHYGMQDEILERRNNLLEEARKLHPERFGTIRKVYRIEPEVRLKHQVTLKKVV